MQFETKVGSELSLIVGNRPKFWCRPGVSGKHVAVQISGVNTEGDDNDE